jgi:LPS O-antigen subunit length determinant protein (WzzB/FepE family)
MSPQAGCAALAAATAALTSSLLASSTWRATAPVDGL